MRMLYEIHYESQPSKEERVIYIEGHSEKLAYREARAMLGYRPKILYTNLLRAKDTE